MYVYAGLACWNSTDDICMYSCTSRRNIQGKSRLLKDFEEEHLNQRNKHLIPHARACGVGYCAHGLRGVVAMQGPQGTISFNSLHAEHWNIAKQNAHFITKMYTDEQQASVSICKSLTKHVCPVQATATAAAISALSAAWASAFGKCRTMKHTSGILLQNSKLKQKTKIDLSEVHAD